MRSKRSAWFSSLAAAGLVTAVLTATPGNAVTPYATTLPSMKVGTAALISPAQASTYYGSATTATDGLAGVTGHATATPPEIVEMARALKNNPDLIYAYVHDNIETEFMYGLQKGVLGAIIDKAGTPFDQAALMVALLRQAGYTASFQAGTITLTGAQFYAWTGLTDSNAACQLLANGGMPAVVNGATTTVCATGAGSTVSSVQMSHVWVKATIAGSSCGANCLFDPSYKAHNWKSGINLSSVLQLTTGDPFAQATTGMDSGTLSGSVPYVHNLNSAALGTKLTAYANNLLNYLNATYGTGAQPAWPHMDDLVGGGPIAADVPPTGGWRQTAFAYTSAAASDWTGNIPDQYRTTLRVSGVMWDYMVGAVNGVYDGTSGAWDTMFDVTFYVDEIYGRALRVDDYYGRGSLPAGAPIGSPYTNTVYLSLDNVMLRTYVDPGINYGNGTIASAQGAPAYMTLVANHPYAGAANGGTTTPGDYMDQTVTKSVVIIAPLTIVDGFGDTGDGLFDKWAEERTGDRAAPLVNTPCQNPELYCTILMPSSLGDFDREKTSASWLAQYTRAAHLHGWLGHVLPQLHHTLGFAYGDNLLSPAYQSLGATPAFGQVENFNRLDIDSAISVTSVTADAASRRAAIQAIAATAAALEGSVAAQLQDVPDTASTATRFEWGNAPPESAGSVDIPANAYEDPSGAGPRKFVQFTAANASSAATLALVEGISVASNTYDGISTVGAQPEIGNIEAQQWSAALSSQVTAYAAAGFTVTTSQEAFLGPGQRAGYMNGAADGSGHIIEYIHSPTKQRGPALIATRYDANGDPLEIAHAVVALPPWGTGSSFATKGGGGGGEPGQSVAYYPSVGADLLKSRFADRSGLLGVNLQTGAFGHVSPVKLVSGAGGFPYALTAEFQWNPGASGILFAPQVATAPGPGFTTNWHNRLSMSGSGREAFGASDARAAVNTIAAFMAVQDIYKAAPSTQRDVAAALSQAWWSHRLEANVVTVSLGTSTRQFLQSAPGQWFAPRGGFGALAVTGTRSAYEEICSHTGPPVNIPPYSSSRGWDVSNMSFAVTGAQGDVQNFVYWRNPYWLNDVNKCGVLKGFRLTNWVFPNGVKINLVYGQPYDPSHGGATADREVEQLVEVNNSLGRKIDFVHDTVDMGTTTGFNNGMAGADARSVSLGTDGAGATTIADPMGLVTKYTFGLTIPAGARPNYTGYGISQIFTPDNPSVANTQIDYDTLGRVKDVQDGVTLQVGGRNPWTFYIAGGTRGERDDPLGAPYTVVYDIYGDATRYLDELGRETDATYDGRGRVLSRLYPEQDQEVFTYDARNNPISLTRIAKPGSPLANLVVSQTFPEAGATVCANIITCNKPVTQTNARGGITNLAWDSATGLPAQVLQPADIHGIRPQTDYAYSSFGADGFKLLTATTQKVTASQSMVMAFTYNSANYYVPLTASNDSTGLNLTTSYTFDALGNRTRIDGPRSDVADLMDFTYDADNRLIFTIQPDPDGAGAHPRPTTKNIYDAAGRIVETDSGTATDGAGGGWSASGASVFTAYDPVGNKIKDWTVSRVSQFSYDGANRLLCTAVRMNRDAAGNFGTLPGDACTVSTPTTFGPDRITKNIYDAAGQLRQELRGFGLGSAPQVYGTYKYSLNGKQIAAADADAGIAIGVSYADALNATTPQPHQTNQLFDGFDRLATTTFSDGTTDQVTAYDAGGNIVTRVNRSGQTFTNSYDALDRVTSKVIPAAGTAAGRTVSFDYNLTGKPLTISDTLGNALTACYDTAGRSISETQSTSSVTAACGTPLNTATTHTVSYQYDAAGNRSRLTWADGYYANYVYDALNHPVTVTDSGGTVLAAYAYDDLARRASLQYSGGAGAKMLYSWSSENDLLTLQSDFAGSANDVAFTNSFTPAHQWAGATLSNAAFSYIAPGGGATYAINALNQYPTLNGTVALGYDARGNYLGAAVNPTFVYDSENELVASTVVGATFAFDPLGRRTQKTLSGVTTNFLHDGDSEIAEYDGSGNLLRRFVPGPVLNDYIAMVTAAGVRTYFHTDKMGSVIAMSDASGNLVEGPYSYDPYGVCQSAGGGCNTGVPFRYTGQRLDAENGCLYYHARNYCPGLGRFIQTDPLGPKDDLNLYTYVGNDPTNKLDPTGRCVEDACIAEAAIACSLNALCRAGVGGGIGFVVGFGGSVINQWATTGSFRLDWRTTAVDTAVGTLVGALSGADPGHGVAYSIAGSVLGDNLNAYLHGQLTPGEFGNSLMHGLIAALATKYGEKFVEKLFPKIQFFMRTAFSATAGESGTRGGSAVYDSMVRAFNDWQKSRQHKDPQMKNGGGKGGCPRKEANISCGGGLEQL